MARNEEKQLGKLNRLWLQKEREEGRIKDINDRRPKLSSLNSPSSVKKWIPSIKNEIEYYLQQSQLSHYPDRKIAEFEIRIKSLEKEYKSFISKLRVLDPTCKEHPWTPRAYSKRRADTQHSATIVKTSRLCKLDDIPQQCNKGEAEQDAATHGLHCFSENKFPNVALNNPISETSEVCFSSQDQPLTFDQTRLAVASAAVRGSSGHHSLSQTHKLAQMLQAGLPNLNNSSSRQECSLQSRERKNKCGITKNSATGQKDGIQDGKVKRTSGELSSSETTEGQKSHSLGLDCYCSTDEDNDT